MPIKTQPLFPGTYKLGGDQPIPSVKEDWAAVNSQTNSTVFFLGVCHAEKSLDEVKGLLASNRQFAVLLHTGLLSEISRGVKHPREWTVRSRSGGANLQPK
jgi:hypothetical protein